MGFVNRKRQDGIDLVTGIRFCGSEGCDILCACLTLAASQTQHGSLGNRSTGNWPTAEIVSVLKPRRSRADPGAGTKVCHPPRMRRESDYEVRVVRPLQQRLRQRNGSPRQNGGLVEWDGEPD